MSDSKPASPSRAAASLGPLLLARKGTAKPAMRAQVAGAVRANVTQAMDELDELASSQEDLGWNDMGEDGSETHLAEVVALPIGLTPLGGSSNLAGINEPAVFDEPAGSNEQAEIAEQAGSNEPAESFVPFEPAVRRQQVDLLHRIADANQAAFEAAESYDKPAFAENARRAAFTLRLDEERHLRLRLASTVRGESAQALVTRALDSLLAQMPEIEQLASQVRPSGQPGGKNKA